MVTICNSAAHPCPQRFHDACRPPVGQVEGAWPGSPNGCPWAGRGELTCRRDGAEHGPTWSQTLSVLCGRDGVVDGNRGASTTQLNPLRSVLRGVGHRHRIGEVEPSSAEVGRVAVPELEMLAPRTVIPRSSGNLRRPARTKSCCDCPPEQKPAGAPVQLAIREGELRRGSHSLLGDRNARAPLALRPPK